MRIAHGATDQSLYFYVQDSASTTGAAKTGLTSTNLTAYYTRTRAAATAIGSLSDLAAATTSHTDGGFKEVDATNSPGVYRFDPPDACFASGVPGVTVQLKWSSGDALAAPKEIDLHTWVGDGNVNSDVKAINASATCAANLAASTGVLLTGSIDTATFTPTNSGSFVFEADASFTETTADHFNSKRVIFTSGELLYSMAGITDYEWSGNSKPKFTCTQIQAIAGSLDNITFVIV